MPTNKKLRRLTGVFYLLILRFELKRSKGKEFPLVPGSIEGRKPPKEERQRRLDFSPCPPKNPDLRPGFYFIKKLYYSLSRSLLFSKKSLRITLAIIASGIAKTAPAKLANLKPTSITAIMTIGFKPINRPIICGTIT